MDSSSNNISLKNSSFNLLISHKDPAINSPKSNISFNSSNDMISSSNSSDEENINHTSFNHTISNSENDFKFSDKNDDSGLYVEDEQKNSIYEILKPLKHKNNKRNYIKDCNTQLFINCNEKNEFFYNVKKIKCNNFDNDEKIKNNTKDIEKKIIQNNFYVILKKFEIAFKKKNKLLLISALNGLNYLSVKYDFPYITELTMKWKRFITIFDLKFSDIPININKIEEIFDKMISEIGNKEKKFIYKNIIINSTKTVKNKMLKNVNKINFYSKDLFPTGNLDENTIDNLINELDNNDEKRLLSKDEILFSKKNGNNCKYNPNQNLKDFDIYGYPFKDESYCNVF